MNKVFCIDEARIITDNQKERVKRNLSQLNSKLKEVNEKLKRVKKQEKKNEIKAILYKRVEQVLRNYGYKEREIFEGAKSVLVSKLKENKGLIAEYEFSIDGFRKDYKAEDIDVEKVEQQISKLKDKIKELKEIIVKEKAELNGLYFLNTDPQEVNPAELLGNENIVFKSPIKDYADQLNKYECDLYEYNAIKVISLLGKSTPKDKIQQYEVAIEKVKSDKFTMGRNTSGFLEELETELVSDEIEQVQEKTSPLMQKAKKTAHTMKDAYTNIIQKSPKLQEIMKVVVGLGGNVKNNIWDLIYLASEQDLSLDVSTYAKTDSETYLKATSGKKTFESHNTLVKKFNTKEGYKELSNKIGNLPHICRNSVKKLLKLGKTYKDTRKEVYTERKGGGLSKIINTVKTLQQTAIKAHRDKFGYLTQKIDGKIEEIISQKQNSVKKEAHLITPDGQEL